MPIEGYVIVSANGMLADATGTMPDSLKFDGDKTFFEAALDEADLIVHGRHSFEDQARSGERKRLVLTRAVPALAADLSRPHATLWNPAGASFADACRYCGTETSGRIAIIGGPAVYALFLNLYDVFWLSQAHDVSVPEGLGVFPDVPAQNPQQILARHGLQRAEVRALEPVHRVDVTAWRRY